ncbi:hypothetical protein AB0F20_09455 [Streptomyces goshikiensis]|uniref:hypothetical protein n=1 Tax=Streptomyces goshikiensis TaxID=1942 RepID=UPI0033CD017D
MSVVVQTQSVDTTAAADDDPLLSYTITTTPSPLKASPENREEPEETGEVVISVARQSRTPANVEWIKVKIPAGDRAPDLATDLDKITPRISLDGWTPHLDASAHEFVFKPRTPHAPIGPDDGFTLQLSNIPMNRTVGTAPITITERSHTGTDTSKNRPTIFNLGKFPPDFYLRDFLCQPSVIPNGGDVRLTWDRSANATYELLYGNVDRDVTCLTTLDVEGIKSDTTFYLRASTSGPNPVVRIVSAQVTVNKPDLEVGNLTVHGSTVLNGSITSNGPVEGPTLIKEFTDEGRATYRAESYGMLVMDGFNSHGKSDDFEFFLHFSVNGIDMRTVIDSSDYGFLSILLRKGDEATVTVSHRWHERWVRGKFTGSLKWIPLGIG